MMQKHRLSREFSSTNSYVKVSQFKYPEDKQKKPQLVYQPMPLNTVREKIFSMGQIDNLVGERGSIMEVPEEAQLGDRPRNKSATIPKRRNDIENYKSFITPRDQSYHPELLIFGRYNYENYTNYAYKNPFRPPAPNIISSRERPKRKQPFNYNPNVETIYYKTRFNDFNQLVQDKLKESRSEAIMKRDKQLQGYREKQASQKKRIQVLVQSDAKPYRVRAGTSSLANLIKQFNVLQKLTQMIETEMHNQKQPLSVNIFDNTSDSASEAIFLEVLIHRFGWLKSLKKKLVEKLFAALGVDQFDRYTKISLKIYVDFIRLFIIRDANESVLSEFLIKLFFGKHQQKVTKQAFEQTLDLMDGPESKHLKIREVYQHFFEDPVAYHGFRTFSESNTNAMHWIVDLFIHGN